MRLLSLLIASLSASVVTSISNFGGGQSALSSTFEVPGKNPLTFCADPKDYILHINEVDLDPNPPKSGTALNITGSGVFSKDIEPGATVALTLKYGLITLIHQTADLCDQVANVDLACPLKAGEMDLTRQVKIPQQIPSGSYTVIADVLTKDGDKITCLESVVYF